MKLLGAEVIAVTSGTRTLKDAMNEAMRDWVANVGDTYYIIGSVVGPHPFPWMVRDFQSVIGREAQAQCSATGGCPMRSSHASAAAATRRGCSRRSSATDVKCFGVEAAGEGVATGRHAATLGAGKRGVLHGSKSYVLQDAGRPDRARALDQRRASTIPASDRSTRTGRRLLTDAIACAVSSAHRMPSVRARRCEPRQRLGVGDATT